MTTTIACLLIIAAVWLLLFYEGWKECRRWFR